MNMIKLLKKNLNTMNNQESKNTEKHYEKGFLLSLQIGFLRKHRYVLFASDGKFSKENQVFQHTFCIVISTMIKLECF